MNPPEKTQETLVVRRVLPAPAEVVYRAWTDPAMITRWSWGPHHDTLSATIDCRVGGAWHHEIRNRNNGEEWTFDGRFEEVIHNQRLVHTFHWKSGGGVEEGTSLVAIDFVPKGPEATEVIITHSRLAAASREGTREGWQDILEQIGQLVASGPRMVPQS